MKKYAFVIMGIAFMLFMSSCINTRNVTSYNQHYAEILGARDALSTMGFELSGEGTRTNNDIYVSSVSYSAETGYGSAMSNNYVTTDCYSFTDTNGNTMSYCVSYELHRSFDKVLYVTNVSVPQCETSNPKDFTRMCGSGSPIKDILRVPQNTPVKIYNSDGTWALIYSIGTVLTIGMLWYLSSLNPIY